MRRKELCALGREHHHRYGEECAKVSQARFQNSEKSSGMRTLTVGLMKAGLRRIITPDYTKEYVKAVYCHPAYLTYMQST